MAAERLETPLELSVEHIGGITETNVSLEPGVNVLTGRNATNRTSFLQAIMAALGSDRPTLKGDAESGHVELSMADDRYTRSLTRQNGRIAYDGEPYLDDAEGADLFAFLLESNDARRAVGRGDDLRELIMRPIDTDEIQAEIAALETEKREIDESLDELDRLEAALPELESERVALEAEIEELESEIEELGAAIDDQDLDVDESRSRRDELEDTFAALREARRELESVEYDIETERESVAELEAERDRLAEPDDDGDPVDGSVDELAGRIDELRARKRSLDETATELQSVIQFNERRLDGDGIGLADSFDSDAASVADADEDAGAVTAQLLEDDDAVVCWTCGSGVERSRIEGTLDRLRHLHSETLTDRNEVQARIGELTDRRSSLQEARREQERLERRRASIAEELDRRRERIEELEATLEEQHARVEELETAADSFDDADYSDVLELHRERNRLEIERDQLESDHADLLDRVDEIESSLEERDSLEAQRESVGEELTERRTRVDRIETEAVEAFNDHIDSLLARLEYGNIDRIWIDRQERTVTEGRRRVDKRVFELHVVRSTAEGRTYDDTVDHLSESEREVIGLVFALAGYLVHEVYEDVPFMLLDSLEAIDADRIARLVEYFEEYAEYLVVALLPEDAQALPEEYTYVTEI